MLCWYVGECAFCVKWSESKLASLTYWRLLCSVPYYTSTVVLLPPSIQVFQPFTLSPPPHLKNPLRVENGVCGSSGSRSMREETNFWEVFICSLAWRRRDTPFKSDPQKKNIFSILFYKNLYHVKELRINFLSFLARHRKGSSFIFGGSWEEGESPSICLSS